LEYHQYQEMQVYLGELIRAFYFLVCVCVCFFHLKEYPQLGQFEVISSLEIIPSCCLLCDWVVGAHGVAVLYN
jgi:hypothetical protein